MFIRILATMVCLIAVSSAEETVKILPDDIETRGDWNSAYGKEAFFLLGQRQFETISMNDKEYVAKKKKVWVKVKDSFASYLEYYSAFGGKYAIKMRPYARSTEKGASHASWITRKRIWRVNEDDVLVHPNGFRSYGNWNGLILARGGKKIEKREEGNLDLFLFVPQGLHCLALYFYETDVPHPSPRRSYKISVFNGDTFLLRTRIKELGTGIYKRFAVTGAIRLRIRIEQTIPCNVQINGIFMDPITSKGDK